MASDKVTRKSRQSVEDLILAILPTPPDFRVSSHGSIFLLTPLTPAANEWAAEHLPEDALHWAGGIVVEHRYISEIVSGIAANGLSVGGE